MEIAVSNEASETSEESSETAEGQFNLGKNYISEEVQRQITDLEERLRTTLALKEPEASIDASLYGVSGLDNLDAGSTNFSDSIMYNAETGFSFEPDNGSNSDTLIIDNVRTSGAYLDLGGGTVNPAITEGSQGEALRKAYDSYGQYSLSPRIVDRLNELFGNDRHSQEQGLANCLSLAFFLKEQVFDRGGKLISEVDDERNEIVNPYD